MTDSSRFGFEIDTNKNVHFRSDEGLLATIPASSIPIAPFTGRDDPLLWRLTLVKHFVEKVGHRDHSFQVSDDQLDVMRYASEVMMKDDNASALAVEDIARDQLGPGRCSKVMFLPDFGCAITFWQHRSHAIDIEVIALDQWRYQVAADAGWNHRSRSHSSSKLAVGRITSSQADAYVKEFNALLQQKRKKGPVTATAIQKVAVDAIRVVSSASIPNAPILSEGMSDMRQYEDGGECHFHIVWEVFSHLVATGLSNSEMIHLMQSHFMVWVSEVHTAIAVQDTSLHSLNKAVTMMQDASLYIEDMGPSPTLSDVHTLLEHRFDITRRSLRQARDVWRAKVCSTSRLPHASSALQSFSPIALTSSISSPTPKEQDMDSIRKSMLLNLNVFPEIIEWTSTWAEVLTWMCRFNTVKECRDFSALQTRLSVLEGTIFGKMLNLDQCDVEHDMIAPMRQVHEQYLSLSRAREEQWKDSLYLPEMRSKTSLALCCMYCIILNACDNRPELATQNFGVSMNWEDVSVFVLRTRQSRDAALAVAKYLRTKTNYNPIFFFGRKDKTLDLARSYNSTELSNITSRATSEAESLWESHWRNVSDLQAQISNLNMQLRGDLTRREEENLRAEINRLESRRPTINQEYPLDVVAMKQCIFFENIPPHLEALASFSYAAQAFGREQCGKVEGIAKYGKEFSPLKVFATSKTFHHPGRTSDYFKFRRHGEASFNTLVVAYDGRDTRNSPQRVKDHFDSSCGGKDLSWAWKPPFKPTKERGNVQVARFDALPPWLNRVEFQVLGSLRSQPRLQLRKVCDCLHSNSLPLGHVEVRSIILQTLLQLGELYHDKCEGELKMLWWRDLWENDGWNTLSSDLGDLVANLKETPREYRSSFLVSQLLAYSAQWDNGEFRVHCRTLCNAVLRWCDALLEKNNGDKPSRARVSQFCLIASICHCGGDLNEDDVASLCTALLLSTHHRNENCEDGSEWYKLMRHLFAEKISIVLSTILKCPQTLTQAVQRIVQSTPSTLEWKLVTTNCSSSCVEALSSDGRFLYAVNIVTGVLLVNGRRPSGLSCTHLELYRRHFDQMEFEVVHSSSASETISSYSGWFYVFREGSNSVSIGARWENQERPCHLELISWEDVRKLIPNLPERLVVMHSHWWDASSNTVYFKDVVFPFKQTHWVARIVVEANNTDGLTEIRCIQVPTQNISDHCTDLVRFLETEDVLVGSNNSALFGILTKFDSTILTFRTNAGYRLVFPRYELSFIISEETPTPLSCDFHGHSLCTDQLLDEYWIGFTNYLVLEGSVGVKKVIVPEGVVTRSDTGVQVRGETSCHSARHYWEYDIHPRFGTMSCKSVEGGLQLGCIFAATSSLLPATSARASGEEIAMEIVRGCWVNRPLSEPERLQLVTLCDMCVHTDSLALLCQHMLDSSNSLSFLHNTEVGWSDKSVNEQESLNIHPRLPQFQQTASSYKSRKGTARISSRQVLTDAEEFQLFGHVCTPGYKALAFTPDLNVTNVLLVWGIRVAEVEEALTSWVGKKKSKKISLDLFDADLLQPQLQPVDVDLLDTVIVESCDLNRDGSEGGEEVGDESSSLPIVNTVLGKDLTTSITESWNTFLSGETPYVSSDAKTINNKSKELLSKVTTWRKDVEERILETVEHVPNNNNKPLCFHERVFFRIRKHAELSPTMNTRDLLRCALNPYVFLDFNPFLDRPSVSHLRSAVLVWIQLCSLEDRLERIISQSTHYNPAHDEKGMLRELYEGRRQWSVTDHPEWAVFEVEQRLQIRHHQYLVARDMLECSSNVTQLNMGEGKTRVIVPMIIMDVLGRRHGSGESGSVPRVVLLDQLADEGREYLRVTLSASVMNYRICQFPFSRDTRLEQSQARELYQWWQLMPQLKGVAVDRVMDRLSMELKCCELQCQAFDECAPVVTQLENIFKLPFREILDESDHLLSHKFQLVYAMGNQVKLPSGPARWDTAQCILLNLAQDEEVLRLLQDGTSESNCEEPFFVVMDLSDAVGGFPNIRFLEGSQRRKVELNRALAKSVLSNPTYPLQWMKTYLAKHDESLATHIIDVLSDPLLPGEFPNSDSLLEDHIDQLMVLRGYLAMGVLHHCLGRRNRVDYGIDRTRKTKVAVPFRANDVPSTRSEFTDPEFVILTTHLAYYRDGVAESDILDSFKGLTKLGMNEAMCEYEGWLELSKPSLSKDEYETINHVNKLDISNPVQLTLLHKTFRHNFRMINFWLRTYILPLETLQFPSKISTSSWHLAEINADSSLCGFSGTNDSRYLLPLSVQMESRVELAGTVGKQLYTVLRCDRHRVYDIGEQLEGVPIIPTIVKHVVDHDYDALIDPGALLVGNSNGQVARAIVDELRSHHRPQGVAYFCDERKQWVLLRRNGSITKYPFPKVAMIVYFDQCRCRGSDIPMRTDAKAFLTVGPRLCKDDFLQACGRMRLLEAGQTLVFGLPAEVVVKIGPAEDGDQPNYIRKGKLVRWLIDNTVREIRNGYLEWSRQGTYHALTKGSMGEVRLEDEVLGLSELYKAPVSADTLSTILIESIESQARQHITQSIVNNRQCQLSQSDAVNSLRHIKEKVTWACAEEVGAKNQDLEECERELENEKELEVEKEKEYSKKTPKSEVNWDFTKLLGANVSSVKDTGLSSVILPLNALLQKVKFDNPLGHLAWENVYATENFIKPISESGLMDVYLRNIDFLVLFNNGDVLLLSDFEADKVLTELWRMVDRSKCEPASLNVNVTFSSISRMEAKVTNSVPMAFGRPVLDVNSSTVTLTTVGVFSGKTNFHAAEQATDQLRKLLSPPPKNVRIVKDLLVLRETLAYFKYSDLDRVIESMIFEGTFPSST